MSRELLQQALDALEALQGGCTDSNDGTVEAITVWCPELIDALREALAAPQPEPVARVVGGNSPGATPWVVWIAHPQPADGSMLYAAPPAAPADMVMVPRKELGDGISLLHQAMVGACDCLTKTHEAKYHAENCFYRKLSAQCDKLEATLAAAPAPAVPLTDEQIDALWRAPMSADWEHREFARAIEAHHGIGGGGK